MNRSSISSSKTLQEFPVPTAAFCGVIALLLLVRIFLAMHPDPLYPLSRDFMEIFARKSDRVYRSQKPKIFLLGSSRLMSLDVRVLGELLGIQHRGIVNVAHEANTYFLMRNFLKRYPEALDHCELLVIDLLPAQLDRYVYLSEESELFLRLASLAEKTKLGRPSTRLLALSDTIFPYYSMRYTALEWHRGLFYSAREMLEYTKKRHSGLQSAIGLKVKHMEVRELIDLMLDGQYPEAHFSPIQRDAFASLLELVPDSTTILLIRPPYRDDVESILQRDEKRRESYEQFKVFFESIDRDNIVKIWVNSAGELGLNDEDYNGDGAHFSASGLRKVSHYLAEFIKEKGLISEYEK